MREWSWAATVRAGDSMRPATSAAAVIRDGGVKRATRVGTALIKRLLFGSGVKSWLPSLVKRSRRAGPDNGRSDYTRFRPTPRAPGRVGIREPNRLERKRHSSMAANPLNTMLPLR